MSTLRYRDFILTCLLHPELRFLFLPGESFVSCERYQSAVQGWLLQCQDLDVRMPLVTLHPIHLTNINNKCVIGQANNEMKAVDQTLMKK